jgi:hypothetical protein
MNTVSNLAACIIVPGDANILFLDLFKYIYDPTITGPTDTNVKQGICRKSFFQCPPDHLDNIYKFHSGYRRGPSRIGRWGFEQGVAIPDRKMNLESPPHGNEFNYAGPWYQYLTWHLWLRRSSGLEYKRGIKNTRWLRI